MGGDGIINHLNCHQLARFNKLMKAQNSILFEIHNFDAEKMSLIEKRTRSVLVCIQFALQRIEECIASHMDITIVMNNEAFSRTNQRTKCGYAVKAIEKRGDIGNSANIFDDFWKNGIPILIIVPQNYPSDDYSQLLLHKNIPLDQNHSKILYDESWRMQSDLISLLPYYLVKDQRDLLSAQITDRSQLSRIRGGYASADDLANLWDSGRITWGEIEFAKMNIHSQDSSNKALVEFNLNTFILPFEDRKDHEVLFINDQFQHQNHIELNEETISRCYAVVMTQSQKIDEQLFEESPSQSLLNCQSSSQLISDSFSCQSSSPLLSSDCPDPQSSSSSMLYSVLPLVSAFSLSQTIPESNLLTPDNFNSNPITSHLNRKRLAVFDTILFEQSDAFRKAHLMNDSSTEKKTKSALICIHFAIKRIKECLASTTDLAIVINNLGFSQSLVNSDYQRAIAGIQARGVEKNSENEYDSLWFKSLPILVIVPRNYYSKNYSELLRSKEVVMDRDTYDILLKQSLKDEKDEFDRTRQNGPNTRQKSTNRPYMISYQHSLNRIKANLAGFDDFVKAGHSETLTWGEMEIAKSYLFCRHPHNKAFILSPQDRLNHHLIYVQDQFQPKAKANWSEKVMGRIYSALYSEDQGVYEQKLREELEEEAFQSHLEEAFQSHLEESAGFIVLPEEPRHLVEGDFLDPERLLDFCSPESMAALEQMLKFINFNSKKLSPDSEKLSPYFEKLSPDFEKLSSQQPDFEKLSSPGPDFEKLSSQQPDFEKSSPRCSEVSGEEPVSMLETKHQSLLQESMSSQQAVATLQPLPTSQPLPSVLPQPLPTSQPLPTVLPQPLPISSQLHPPPIPLPISQSPPIPLPISQSPPIPLPISLSPPIPLPISSQSPPIPLQPPPIPLHPLPHPIPILPLPIPLHSLPCPIPVIPLSPPPLTAFPIEQGDGGDDGLVSYHELFGDTGNTGNTGGQSDVDSENVIHHNMDDDIDDNIDDNIINDNIDDNIDDGIINDDIYDNIDDGIIIDDNLSDNYTHSILSSTLIAFKSTSVITKYLNNEQLRTFEKISAEQSNALHKVRSLNMKHSHSLNEKEAKIALVCVHFAVQRIKESLASPMDISIVINNRGFSEFIVDPVYNDALRAINLRNNGNNDCNNSGNIFDQIWHKALPILVIVPKAYPLLDYSPLLLEPMIPMKKDLFKQRLRESKEDEKVERALLNAADTTSTPKQKTSNSFKLALKHSIQRIKGGFVSLSDFFCAGHSGQITWGEMEYAKMNLYMNNSTQSHHKNLLAFILPLRKRKYQNVFYVQDHPQYTKKTEWKGATISRRDTADFNDFQNVHHLNP